MKKAKQPILYAVCSLSSFLFEYLVLFLLEFFFGAWMGEYAQKIVEYGESYLDIFPNGKARTAVQNSINQAKAEL